MYVVRYEALECPLTQHRQHKPEKRPSIREALDVLTGRSRGSEKLVSKTYARTANVPPQNDPWGLGGLSGPERVLEARPRPDPVKTRGDLADVAKSWRNERPEPPRNESPSPLDNHSGAASFAYPGICFIDISPLFQI